MNIEQCTVRELCLLHHVLRREALDPANLQPAFAAWQQDASSLLRQVEHELTARSANQHLFDQLARTSTYCV